MYTKTSTMEAIDTLIADPFASWSYDEAAALVEWYEEFEECTGKPIEFCPVSVRCDWTGSHIDDVINNYDNLMTDILETEEDKIEWLSGYTQVIMLKNGNLLYIQF